MIADEPDLPGVGLVMFDEVHERALAADLGLAFALEAHSALRPDLRLMAMSATVDGARFKCCSQPHGTCQRIESDGAMFPSDPSRTERPACPASGAAPRFGCPASL
jgi:ATP-dependent helicase HrpB